MNRRGFLSTLAALTAAAAFDPEKLLWVPGQKKIFIPKPIRKPIWAGVDPKTRRLVDWDQIIKVDSTFIDPNYPHDSFAWVQLVGGGSVQLQTRGVVSIRVSS